ncbi:MAG: hypothetical protein U0893_27800 [Chloroflexota bacterium]
MAVADQTTAAAMVRRFAALLADDRAVERIWYHAVPGRIHPDHLALDVYVQLAQPDDDAAQQRVTDTMLRVWPIPDPSDDAEDDIDLAVISFALDALIDRNIAEVLDLDLAIEIPVRES